MSSEKGADAMAEAVATSSGGAAPPRPLLDHKQGPATAIVFFCLLAGGLGYGIHGLLDDMSQVHEALAFGVFALLGIALLIALGFEFVNGFHDTANAVAT